MGLVEVRAMCTNALQHACAPANFGVGLFRHELLTLKLRVAMSAGKVPKLQKARFSRVI